MIRNEVMFGMEDRNVLNVGIWILEAGDCRDFYYRLGVEQDESTSPLTTIGLHIKTKALGHANQHMTNATKTGCSPAARRDRFCSDKTRICSSRLSRVDRLVALGAGESSHDLYQNGGSAWRFIGDLMAGWWLNPPPLKHTEVSWDDEIPN